MAFHEKTKSGDLPKSFAGWLIQHASISEVYVIAGNGKGRQKELLDQFFSEVQRTTPEDFYSESTAFGLTAKTTLPRPPEHAMPDNDLGYEVKGNFLIISNEVVAQFALKMGAKLKYPYSQERRNELNNQTIPGLGDE